MPIKGYVIKDRTAIDFIEDNDIDGFKQYLSEEEYLMFDEPIQFETETEALAFCAGLGYGVDDTLPVAKFPLRSFEEYDQPYIKAIEEY